VRYFGVSLLVALALALMALISGALFGTSASDAAVTVLGYEGWWALLFWIPLTAISLQVCVAVWATRFLPWVEQDSSAASSPDTWGTFTNAGAVKRPALAWRAARRGLRATR
jgi:formate-dependent nitrite reductase membrane component NrfD